MIAVIDYGVGNLFSLTASLKYLGADVKVTGNPADLEDAGQIILPGVGAFSDARQKLEESGLVDVIYRQVEKGKPMLGICLGMQLLFETSYEYGNHKGLGLVAGDIVSIEKDLTTPLKVPHIGWNQLKILVDDPLFKYIKNGEYVYYVHSYYGKNCEKDTIAVSEYDVSITGAVRHGNVYGTQFHPEKSGAAGMNILRAFKEMKE